MRFRIPAPFHALINKHYQFRTLVLWICLLGGHNWANRCPTANEFMQFHSAYYRTVVNDTRARAHECTQRVLRPIKRTCAYMYMKTNIHNQRQDAALLGVVTHILTPDGHMVFLQSHWDAHVLALAQSFFFS